VALVANWLRAYVFVLSAHILKNRIGTDAEHTMLGWVIFAAAMFTLFAIGMRWSDKDDASVAPPARTAGAQPRIVAMMAALAASLLTIAAWPALAAHIDARVDARPIKIEAIAPAGGWQVASTPSGHWAPEIVAPVAVDTRTFALGQDIVNVYLGLYRGQKQGSEVVNSLNQVARSGSTRWRVIARGTVDIRLTGTPTSVRTAVVRGTDGEFLIWHWYWLAGYSSCSDVEVKLRLAWQRLTGATDTAAWVAVYTPLGDGVNAGARRLTAFLETMSGPIDDALVATSE